MGLSDEIARQDASDRPRVAGSKRDVTLANCRELAEMFRSNGMNPPAPYFHLVRETFGERRCYDLTYLGGYWRISEDEHTTYGLSQAGLPVVLYRVDSHYTTFEVVDMHFKGVPRGMYAPRYQTSFAAVLKETDIYAISEVGIDLNFTESKLAAAFRAYRGPAPAVGKVSEVPDDYLVRALGVQVTNRIKPDLRGRLTTIYPALADTIDEMYKKNRGPTIDVDPELIQRFLGIFSKHGVISAE